MGTKISLLTALPAAAMGDLLPVVDVSATETRKGTVAQLLAHLPDGVIADGNAVVSGDLDVGAECTIAGYDARRAVRRAFDRSLKSASFTWDPADCDGVLFIDTATGAVTITLPAVLTLGVTIKKVNNGTNKITIARAGSDKIEGQALATLDLPGSDTATRGAWRIEGQTGASADSGWWVL
jgi:hypothetical protein